MQLDTETVTTKRFTLHLNESELAVIAAGLRHVIDSFVVGSPMQASAKIMYDVVARKLPQRYLQQDIDFMKYGTGVHPPKPYKGYKD